MADKDLRDLAINATEDFYELLEIPTSANDSDVKRAYRRLALKYHPDKVAATGDVVAAAEKFHSLKIAHDALLEPDIRQLYDNNRRAQQQRKEREAVRNEETQGMVADLLRRERDAARARGRSDVTEVTPHDQKLAQLAEESRRMRERYVAKKLREEEEELRREQSEYSAKPKWSNLSYRPGRNVEPDRLRRYQQFWEDAEAGLEERLKNGDKTPKFPSFKGPPHN